ncbi:urease accessory protein UreE [Ignatzschineria ureiclastica]|uniref:Urease accessory protein UreE n=1 Tax=Ignatzschineria ureiclastica TaxID=472582 RepID=A0A2U2ADE3_9GAMM|nr:urease accessory protein UreE [Ignatzschineria ureiclastica]PWD80671.1 urease accessory protein UreE [Ignatzschineria ureiclastica]GGZ95422.1 urease accessory protein UreE [Ignatzschineria ureiclastica]
MIIIEKVLGNIKQDSTWQDRKKESQVDILRLDQHEAQKSRCRKHTEKGQDLGIALDRNVLLADGDVLFYDEITHTMIIVEISLRDVLVVDLSHLGTMPVDAQIRVSFELGHALGNQHWKAVLKENHVYVPLSVSKEVMASVMRTHGFDETAFKFVPGGEILPKMSRSEARLLFGGSEETHTHVHVSPQGHPYSHSHDDHHHNHNHDHDHNHSHEAYHEHSHEHRHGDQTHTYPHSHDHKH